MGNIAFSSMINLLSPITLEQMSAIRLMNRTDTKYTVPRAILPTILEMAKEEYLIQDIDGDRNPCYHTIYLDTEEKAMFLAHQNGKKTREKIRLRTYKSSDITFLEVKNKNNKGRTDKKRIQIRGYASLEEDGAASFLQKHAWYHLAQLSPHLENNFRRITLVNRKMTERLTIDTDICFNNFVTSGVASLSELCIIELKRDGYTYSPMCKILNELRVRPQSMSKYCMGAVLTNPTLKYNRFKPKLRSIERVIDSNNQLIYE